MVVIIIKNNKGQQNFLNQGFDREKCVFNEEYPCTHYWAVNVMQGCDNEDCDKKCCMNCKEVCGYRCNAAK